MILFLTALLLMTIGALTLFIFPILPLNRGRGKAGNAKKFYIGFVFFLFAVLVPVLYGRQGRVMMPDYPLNARDTLEAETQTTRMAKIRRLERYLSATPDDGGVWQRLAEAYRGAGYYDQAATAYRNAIEWGIPQDISNWHALAETIIQANNGRITGFRGRAAKSAGKRFALSSRRSESRLFHGVGAIAKQRAAKSAGVVAVFGTDPVRRRSVADRRPRAHFRPARRFATGSAHDKTAGSRFVIRLNQAPVPTVGNEALTVFS